MEPSAPARPTAARFDLSVVIVNYNTERLLRPCLDALHASAGDLRLQVIVIDNASRDGSTALLEAYEPPCTLIRNTVNVGFGRANNQALPLIEADHVLLLNTDAFVPPDAIASTLAFMRSRPDCGVLGVKLIGSDGELQPSCRYFPTPLNSFLLRTGLSRLFPGVRLIDDMAWPHDRLRECDWVPGCYYMVPTAVLTAVGLFDPRFFMYFEEVDHCKAVKAAGWKVMYFPDTSVVHLGGESAKSTGSVTSVGKQISVLQMESELLFFRKHLGVPGVLAAVLLNALADTYVAAKDAVRRAQSRHASAAAAWRNVVTTCRLLRQTSWGAKATR